MISYRYIENTTIKPLVSIVIYYCIILFSYYILIHVSSIEAKENLRNSRSESLVYALVISFILFLLTNIVVVMVFVIVVIVSALYSLCVLCSFVYCVLFKSDVLFCVMCVVSYCSTTATG
jgi:hypothetical protein